MLRNITSNNNTVLLSAEMKKLSITGASSKKIHQHKQNELCNNKHTACIEPILKLNNCKERQRCQTHFKPQENDNNVYFFKDEGCKNVNMRWTCYTTTYEQIKYIENKTSDSCYRYKYIMTKYMKMWRSYVAKKRSSGVSTVTSNITCTDNKIRKNNETLNNGISVTRESAMKYRRKECTEPSRGFNSLNEISELEQLEMETDEISKMSRNALEKMLHDCDKNLKRKTKFALDAISKTASTTANYKNSWQLITKMEQRAEERRRKWSLIKERKRELEEEKFREIERTKQEEKLKLEKEKKEKLQEIRRKKKEMEEIKKKQRAEREYMQMMSNVATEYYRRQLLSNSLKKFNQIVHYSKIIDEKARLCYEQRLLSRSFLKIKLNRIKSIEGKTVFAEEVYQKILLRKSFYRFKRIHSEYARNVEAAKNLYNFRLLKNSYYSWKLFIYKRRYENKIREENVKAYYNRKLLKRCIFRWKNYKQVLFEEREKEKRLRLWRNKVQEALPDFEMLFDE